MIILIGMDHLNKSSKRRGEREKAVSLSKKKGRRKK